MRLYQLWLANAAAFALFKLYLVPRLRRYIEHHRSRATIRKGAMLSLASWIESILLIAAISGGVVLAISLVVQFGSGATAEQVGGVIASVQRWRDRVWGFGPAWGGIVLGFNVFALGLYARRRGRIRMTKSFEAVRQNEIDGLKREAAAGQWEAAWGAAWGAGDFSEPGHAAADWASGTCSRSSTGPGPSGCRMPISATTSKAAAR